jgi:hypothetical protein
LHGAPLLLHAAPHMPPPPRRFPDASFVDGIRVEAGDCTGRDCTGRDCVGRDCVGRDCVGRDCVGRDCVGRDCVDWIPDCVDWIPDCMDWSPDCTDWWSPDCGRGTTGYLVLKDTPEAGDRRATVCRVDVTGLADAGGAVW